MTVQPPRWSLARIEADVELSKARFREQRLDEPLDDFLTAFEEYRRVVDELLELTLDLSQLRELAPQVVLNQEYLTVVRALSSPIISLDDMKTLSDCTLSKRQLTKDDGVASYRVIDTALHGLDRERFPWVSAGRTPDETEKTVAVTSTAVAIAQQKILTARRTAAKQLEENVVDYLSGHGLTEVGSRKVENYADMPAAGEFTHCKEKVFGDRKADLVVATWDSRVAPIECKVSNSSTNSYKRLNNDAAKKGSTWSKQFGDLTTVPMAVVSGVYGPKAVKKAQDEGLTIFWEHDLDALGEFLAATKK